CMSDRIAFLDKGEILAHANPKELYFKPNHKSARILPDLNIIELNKQELDLKALIEERLEYFKIFFEQKKISLKLNLHQASIFA
ncbi:hypothetical protein VWM83_09735, partial [Campylobacter coli]